MVRIRSRSPRLLPALALAPGLALGHGQKLNGPLPAPGSGDVIAAQFSADGARAVFLTRRTLQVGGDAGSIQRLWSTPFGGGTPVELNAPLGLLGDVLGFAIPASGGRVVYRAEQDSPTVAELYSVPADGSAAPVRLNAPLGTGGGVTEFGFTADGSRVVFLASQGSGQPLHLFAAPTDGSAAAVELDGALTPAFALSPAVPRFLVAGTRVAFLADALADGRRELFSAPLDGSAAPLQLSGPIFADAEMDMDHGTVLKPFEFRVSADGARVVYLGDAVNPGTVELYSVPADGSAAAVRLNDPLPMGESIGELEITPNGTTVVFSHGATLHRVPIDGSGAPLQLDPAGTGAILEILVHPAGARVLYVRRGPGLTGRVYTVTLAGGAGTALSAAGAQVRNLQVGTARVVYESTPEGTTNTTIYSASILGGGSPLALNGSLLPTSTVKIAADGIGVAFLAQPTLTEPVELYGVPISGGVAPVRLCDPQALVADASTFTLGPSSSQVLYVADQDTDEVLELYARVVGSSAPAVKLNPSFPPGPTIGDVAWSTLVPGAGYALYLANQDVAAQLELYSVSLSSGALPVKLNGPLPEGGNVAFGDGPSVHIEPVITPDGSRVVFVASRLQGGSALYSARTDGAEPPLELSGSVQPHSTPLLLSPGGDEVVFEGFDTTTRLLRVPVDGSAPPSVIDTVSGAKDYRLDPTGMRLVYLTTRLFSVPLDGSQSAVALGPSFTVSSSVESDFRISPDGSRVVLRSPAGTSVVKELYSAPIDGSTPAVKLNAPPAASGGVEWTFAISPDSTRVVYCTDQDVRGLYELYVVPIQGGTAPLKLNQQPGNQDVERDFQISPDGARVVYRQPEIAETLYSVPIDRSAEPIAISPAANPSFGGLSGFSVLPGGGAVVYQIGAAAGWNLYRVPLAGGASVLLNDPAVPATSARPELTLDGSWVLYEVQHAGNGYDLWAASTHADGLSVRINAPLVPDGSVREHVASPSGAHVLYLADQDTLGVVELYHSPLPARPFEHFPPALDPLRKR